MKLQSRAKTLMLTTAMVGVVCGAMSAEDAYFRSIGAEMHSFYVFGRYYFFYTSPIWSAMVVAVFAAGARSLTWKTAVWLSAVEALAVLSAIVVHITAGE